MNGQGCQGPRLACRIAVLLLGFHASPVTAALRIEGVEPGQWVGARQELMIRYAPDRPVRGTLRFFIGKREITALLQRQGDGLYRYPARQWPLPPGSWSLRVYRVGPQGWQLQDEQALNVLTRGGFEESRWTPQADLAGSGRNEEAQDNGERNRDRQRSLALNAGLQSEHHRAQTRITSRWQWVGASSDAQSLQFETRGADAPRLDLSEYRIDVQHRSYGLTVGHQEQGGNPLMIDGFHNRGVGIRRFSEQGLSVSLAAQALRPRVGWSDMLGLADQTQDRVLSIGVTLPIGRIGPAPLRLRVDAASARRIADPGFDEASVTELALGRGLGLSVLMGEEGGDWDAHIDYARSRYQNPPEPFETGFDDPPADRVSRGEARAIGLGYTFRTGGDGEPEARIRLDWRRIDPFYQTLTAEVMPNEEQWALALEGRWTRLGWQLSGVWSEDNLDDLQTVLKTLTREQRLTVNLDLNDGVPTEGRGWPSGLSLELGRVHQFGDNLPVGFDADSHVPDQVDTQQALGMDWELQPGVLSLRYAHSRQDNRQPGRARADFTNREASLSFIHPLGERVQLQLAWTQVRAEDREQAIERRSREWQLGLDADLGSGVSSGLSWTQTREDDDRQQNTHRNNGFQVQVSWQDRLPGWASDLPVQAYLRFGRTADNSIDRLFNLESDQRSRAWDLGFSLSFF